MKKTLALFMVLSFTISMLSACGGSSDTPSNSSTPSSNTATTAPASSNTKNENNTNNNSPKATKDVISASTLLSAEDATDIMEEKMEPSTFVPMERPFIDQIKYNSEERSIKIELWQEALYDESSSLQQDVMKNGWVPYMQKQQKSVANLIGSDGHNVVEVNGIGDATYLQEGLAFGQWLLHVFYGEYWFSIVISNNRDSLKDSEAEITWKQEKIIEAGKLSLEHLKAIVG